MNFLMCNFLMYIIWFLSFSFFLVGVVEELQLLGLCENWPMRAGCLTELLGFGQLDPSLPTS